MRSLDFIRTARDLTTTSSRRPRQANLRRAVSTTYYAMFHCLAGSCADLIVGGAGASRSKHAWRQAFANVFIDMQKKRHRADYDPYAVFSKLAVVQGIQEAENVISDFVQAPRKDRRAFAVYVLLDIRK